MNGMETAGSPPQKRGSGAPEGLLKTGLFVKGVHQAAAAGAVFERLDPSTGLVSSIAADGRAADAEQMVSVAAASFSAWSGLGGAERAAILRRAKALVPRYAARFQDSMLRETGATAEWVEFNLRVAADVFEATAQLAEQFGNGRSQQADEPSQAVRVPAGVCLAIAPWNAPLALGIRAIAFPLAFGNTVIFKASELCPVTHVLLGELLHEAGLPAGVLSILTNAPENSREVVETLIACAPVRRVNFTGSTRVGRIIAGIAASHLKRCLLELGGKSPLIVLPDADIGQTVEAALFGAYLNSGQICMATDRIIVDHAIADAFVAALAERASALTAGDPRNPGVRIGPLATSSIAVRLSALIEDAVTKGGVLRSGGPARGQFMDATVIDHVSPMMRIYSEECFGPLVGIYRVGSVEEAVTVANDCEYGLSSAVFGSDLSAARAVADQLETGICHINSATVADDPFMPFGGVKSSGYGRFGGPGCLDEFTELRWITSKRVPREA
ncbi:aldehyde dehydrogenase [Roseibium litorale]|uniref:Aldehyde dehydrogenase n=1 Tax=Roseibium litorale TaxID=2803841 RepID=A0ABR9CMU2_9HYPH|nr:aldehyde dehydrogenase [Roseibium litorale]MBD8892189.1 aldehyde dehydrogenase [Roseibium litorale]